VCNGCWYVGIWHIFDRKAEGSCLIQTLDTFQCVILPLQETEITGFFVIPINEFDGNQFVGMDIFRKPDSPLTPTCQQAFWKVLAENALGNENSTLDQLLIISIN